MSDIFNHEADAWDSLNDDDDDRYPYRIRTPRCNRCGSTEVRWRRQTDKWVLFSSQPGVVHVCATADPDAFDVIKE